MANRVKNYKNYNYISRYESFPYYYDEENNKYYYGLTSNLITDNTSYTVYQTKAGDSYDSIALDNYGSALLYWVICDYNWIQDCLEPLQIGTVLKIPSINAITFER